jgi:methionine-rich copper-binding protein CopC
MSRRTSRPVRCALATVAVVAALLGGALLTAAPASAHVSVVGTSPAAGAVLHAAPSAVEVQFDSGLLDIGFAMVVRSADGHTVSSGRAQVGLDSISTATDPAAGPGTYTVAFRVVSADGHEVTSSFTYTVTGEATPTTTTPTPLADREVEGISPAPNPPRPDDRGTRWSPTLVLGVGVAAVAGAGLLAWALLAGRTQH